MSDEDVICIVFVYVDDNMDFGTGKENANGDIEVKRWFKITVEMNTKDYLSLKSKCAKTESWMDWTTTFDGIQLLLLSRA